MYFVWFVCLLMTPTPALYWLRLLEHDREPARHPRPGRQYSNNIQKVLDKPHSAPSFIV